MENNEIQSMIESELQKTGCYNVIPHFYIESCARCYSRYLECEKQNDRFGLLAKNHSNGAVSPSPYVQIGLTYLREGNMIWEKIMNIVRKNKSINIEVNEILCKLQKSHNS